MSDTATLQSGTQTWQIDPTHSQVEFEVKHMMFAKVRGRFESVAGRLTLGEGDGLEHASVEAVIESSSINTGVEQRDAHLRSGDFFDVETFPQLRFSSSSVRRTGNDTLSVTGDLTIRDVTREVELTVTESGRGIDPWGNTRAGFSATTIINRHDYGLNWNQALEAGGILVGPDVKIMLEIQALPQAS